MLTGDYIFPLPDISGSGQIYWLRASLYAKKPAALTTAGFNAPKRVSACASGKEWLEHCGRRERAERAAAKNACSAIARGIHQELAQAYANEFQRAKGERP